MQEKNIRKDHTGRPIGRHPEPFLDLPVANNSTDELLQLSRVRVSVSLAQCDDHAIQSTCERERIPFIIRIDLRARIQTDIEGLGQ